MDRALRGASLFCDSYKWPVLVSGKRERCRTGKGIAINPQTLIFFVLPTANCCGSCCSNSSVPPPPHSAPLCFPPHAISDRTLDAD